MPLQYWGLSALNNIVGVIGKPIRTNRATAQKDILEFAGVLVEVSIDQEFPNEIIFCNEKGKMISQQVLYECKPVLCSDCGGIGHNMEQCRKKKFEVAKGKLKPHKQWIPKPKPQVQATIQQPAQAIHLDKPVQIINRGPGLATIEEGVEEEGTGVMNDASGSNSHVDGRVPNEQVEMDVVEQAVQEHGGQALFPNG